MRIGIDLDGPVYPFDADIGDWISLATGRERKEMPPATDWHFYRQWGYSDEEFLRHFERGVDNGYVFAAAEPVTGARLALRRLKAAGHTLHIITDRFIGMRSVENTGIWLAKCGIPYDTLTFSADKTIVRTDTFIDDKPGNVDALRAAGCQAWLFDCRRDDQRGHPFLVSGWGEFEEKVEKLAAEQEIA